jgi:hypothetical protein
MDKDELSKIVEIRRSIATMDEQAAMTQFLSLLE